MKDEEGGRGGRELSIRSVGGGGDSCHQADANGRRVLRMIAIAMIAAAIHSSHTD